METKQGIHREMDKSAASSATGNQTRNKLAERHVDLEIDRGGSSLLYLLCSMIHYSKSLIHHSWLWG